jgi:ubiquinone/menaquinone biosynthesis C-methylase UbiE
MAIVAPTASKEELRERILAAVQDMYTEVASCPARGFHFPTGRWACEYVGYPASELDAVPQSAVESFAGVEYPFRAGVLQRGDIVLDVGSGSATDTLIAALKVGPEGKVYGLDMTDAMIEKARANVQKAGISNVEIIKGNAEAIPLPNECCDVVTSNGVLNLVPDKSTAFQQIYRVLKSGGYIQISDIVLTRDLSEKSRNNAQLWAECIVGAITQDGYLELIRSVGFEDVRVLNTMNYFAKSPSESTQKAAEQYGAIAITLVGRK